MLLQTSGLTDGPYDASEIIDITLADSMNGWILFENGFIARSLDAGQTWCDLFYDEGPVSASKERLMFKRIHFTDSQSGWALSKAGNLYRTRDGGSAWAEVADGARISDIFFLDSTHVWALGTEGIFRINP
jgi:photosystem II stability/assembly factor-like uncharacterized protein